MHKLKCIVKVSSWLKNTDSYYMTVGSLEFWGLYVASIQNRRTNTTFAVQILPYNMDNILLINSVL